jgi:hypothetical protein
MTFVLTHDKLYDVVWSDPMTSSAKPIYVTLHQALQPLSTARTSGKRCASAMKRASKGEVLSRRHARASRRGTFKSTMGKMATVPGHRHRALPEYYPSGTVQAPMSPAQIKAKFDSCAAQAIGNSAAEKIYAMLNTIGEQPSFAEFWPLLRKG